MRILILVLCLVAGHFNFFAQDSIAFTKDFRLYEGLYLNYNEFRVNWPIPKEKIITTIDKEQLDFYSKLIEQDVIEYKERDGNVAKIASDKVWGYCQNNTVFLNINKSFFRIPIFGALSSFLATVEVQSISQGYDPFMNPIIGSSQSKVKEIRQFLFDFYTNEVMPLTTEKVETYLIRDSLIFSEYSQLSKKKKREFTSKYIRMYNEKHPIYFPKE